MSGAIYRARKRIEELAKDYQSRDWDVFDVYEGTGYRRAVEIIDEEIEADAEKEFSKPIKQVEFSG